MQKHAALIAIVAVIFYGIYNARHRAPVKKRVSPNYAHHVAEHTTSHAAEELERLATPQSTRDYILDVINHGSQALRFKKDEIMEAGFASPEDAPKIAAFVMELRGEPLDGTSSKDGAMFFTSICGGCHGDDGRGLGGTYPDLTRRPLLGIAQRLEHLQSLAH